MRRCAAITREGAPCKGLVRPGNDHCPAHDPARQDARKKAASKAGRSKRHEELPSIKRQLQALVSKVEGGKMDRADASVCGQLLNILIRAIEVGRRLDEQEVLLQRLEGLENELGQYNAFGGGRRGR